MQTIFTKREATKVLKISVETVDRARKAGKLPFRLVGDRVIFTESDLSVFIENCAVPCAEVTNE